MVAKTDLCGRRVLDLVDDSDHRQPRRVLSPRWGAGLQAEVQKSESSSLCRRLSQRRTVAEHLGSYSTRGVTSPSCACTITRMSARYLALALLTCAIGCKAPTEGTGNSSAESSEGTSSSGDATTTDDFETTDNTTAPGTTDGETEESETTDASESETGSETEDPVDTFDDAMQWYCSGQCSPTNPPTGTMEGCEPEDAHAFCQAITGNPGAMATFWEQAVAVDGPGFCCLGMGPVFENVLDWAEVCYSSTTLLPDHEGGSVILRDGLQCG